MRDRLEARWWQLLLVKAGRAASKCRARRLAGTVKRMAGVMAVWLVVQPVSYAGTPEPINPIPEVAACASVTQCRKLQLGEVLFNSALLSGNPRVSCASCHNLLDFGGSDAVSVSGGMNGKAGGRRVPSVFNVGFNFVQFWDGHAATLEDQLDAVVSSLDGLDTDWPALLGRVNADPALRALFEKVYGAPADRARVVDSLVDYERSLSTPDSRFDRYLRGEHGAISAEELEGYHLFKQYGCASCHQGTNVGGNMFQPLGVVGGAGKYFREHGTLSEQDYGRYNVTHVESDRFVFKVPSLRNVALRAPYFNDGSVATLEDAIRLMGRYQLGRTLGENDIRLIAKFLGTLTGTYRGKPLTRAGGPQ